MFRACLMARVRRRWCVVHTPVSRRGTILPRSATNPCSRQTWRYGIASIFSVQNLQTFLRRKNLPRPPGPPEGRPPGRAPGREPELSPEPEPGPDAAWGASGALVSGAFASISSDMLFPLYSLVNSEQWSVDRKYVPAECHQLIANCWLNRGRLGGFCCFQSRLRHSSRRSHRGWRCCAPADATQGLDLGQTLLFLVDAHGDEFDHRLGNAQAALQLQHHRAVGLDGQQNVVAVVELAHHVGELALAHLLHRLDQPATLGDIVGEAGDQLVDIFFGRIRPNNEHDFIHTGHPVSFSAGALLTPAAAALSSSHLDLAGLMTSPYSLVPSPCFTTPRRVSFSRGD